MPSGMCSRRAGFVGAIRLLASLIVLVSLPAGNFGKRVGKTNKRANALAGPRQSHLYALTAHGLRTAAPVQRGLLGVVMAWQRPVPAFPDGMTGQPIWSLHSRARSARCAYVRTRKIEGCVELARPARFEPRPLPSEDCVL